MGDESCRSCMVYKQGDCIGREVCELYRPIPSSGGKDYWPGMRRSKSFYAEEGKRRREDYLEALDIKRKQIENPITSVIGSSQNKNVVVIEEEGFNLQDRL